MSDYFVVVKLDIVSAVWWEGTMELFSVGYLEYRSVDYLVERMVISAIDRLVCTLAEWTAG